MGTQGFNARPLAMTLILGSGLILFFLGFSLQAMAWTAKAVIAGLQTETPAITRQFVRMFGMRPHSYLASVTLWLWWPMVASAVYCHFRYPARQSFAIAFAYWFALCWLLVAMALATIAFILSLPLFILLADIEQPPDFMAWVPLISWILPGVVMLFGIGCWWLSLQRGKP